MSLVSADGSEFRLNGERFDVAGVNCYFLAYCGQESHRAALATARRMGANIVRCWAFLAVEQWKPGQVAFQSFEAGRFDIHDGPDGLERLDALIASAEEMDVKLILPLVNYWDDLGGMNMYVRHFSPGAGVTEFYRNPAIRAAYREWVAAILNRRNTSTGRLYADEPAIMAWELTNEARCQVSGGRQLLLDWVTEMAAFVKLQDPNHLLALGDEGFFYGQGAGHVYDGTNGVDWLANLSVADIDFGTFHLYPQGWGHARNLNFAKRWIEDHIQAARRMNKPALLEEFGLKLDAELVKTPQDRAGHYASWKKTVEDHGGAGQLLWMLGHATAEETRGFADEYVVYEPAELL